MLLHLILACLVVGSYFDALLFLIVYWRNDLFCTLLFVVVLDVVCCLGCDGLCIFADMTLLFVVVSMH